MTYAFLHVELIHDAKVLLESALEQVKFNLQPLQIHLIEFPSYPNHQIVVNMVTELDVATIGMTLMKVATFRLDYLEAICQMSPHPGFPKYSATLHASIECLIYSKGDFWGDLAFS